MKEYFSLPEPAGVEVTDKIYLVTWFFQIQSYSLTYKIFFSKLFEDFFHISVFKSM